MKFSLKTVGSYIEKSSHSRRECCVQFIQDEFLSGPNRRQPRCSGSSVLCGLEVLWVTLPRTVFCLFSTSESPSQSLNPFYLENGILKVLTLWGFCEH